MTAPEACELAGLARRLLSLVYEALLLTAVALAAMVPFVMLSQNLDAALKRPLTQLYLVLVTGAYFAGQWTKLGQTLAMKTWRLKLVARDGRPPGWACSLRRYALALGGIALFGAGFVWALVDRERQFLHDRLAGTRIIFVPATRSSPPPR